MELPELVNDPIKGFGINRFGQGEHGTLAKTEAEPEPAPKEEEEVDADLIAENPDSEETTLNTSGVQEGLNERVKNATEEHQERSA